MSKLYLGIDTSNYTTSLGIIDDSNNIILNLRKMLKVKKDSRGLRQQEAVFQHLNNLPILIAKMSESINVSDIISIGSSSNPRNNLESYMPVFLVGKNQAFILSKVLNTSYKEFSHQEGHIGSALLNKNFNKHQFLSLHISGGTTELLLINNEKQNYEIEIMGGSLDISMGQLIDRIGVFLGFDFPSGREMDKVAQNGKLINKKTPFTFKEGLFFNLSGLENYFKKMIDDKTYKKEDVIYTLFHTMSLITIEILIKASKTYNIDDYIITGGVSANSIIRNHTNNNIKGNIILPDDTSLSTDNGIGIAYLAKIYKGH